MKYLCALFGIFLTINVVYSVKNLKVKGPAPDNRPNANQTHNHHRYEPKSSPKTSKAPPHKEPPNTIYEFGSDDSEKYFMRYPPPTPEKLTQIPKPESKNPQNDTPSAKDYVTTALQQGHRHKKDASKMGASSFVEYSTVKYSKETVRPTFAKKLPKEKPVTNSTKLQPATDLSAKTKKPKIGPKVSEKRNAEYYYQPGYKETEDTYYEGSDPTNYFTTQDAEQYPYETSVYQFVDDNEAFPSDYMEMHAKNKNKFQKTPIPYYQSEEYLSKLKNSKPYQITTEKPAPAKPTLKPKDNGKQNAMPYYFNNAESNNDNRYNNDYPYDAPENEKPAVYGHSTPASASHSPSQAPQYEPRPHPHHRPTHSPNSIQEYSPRPSQAYTQRPNPQESNLRPRPPHPSHSPNHETAQTPSHRPPYHDSSYSPNPRPSPAPSHDSQYSPNSHPHVKPGHDSYTNDQRPINTAPHEPPHPPSRRPSPPPREEPSYASNQESNHQEYRYQPIKQKPKQKPEEPQNYPTQYEEESVKNEVYMRPTQPPHETDEETTIYVKVKNKNPENFNRKPTSRPPAATTADTISINPSYYYKPKMCDAYGDYDMVRKNPAYDMQKKSKRENQKATKKSGDFYADDVASDKQYYMMPEPQALAQHSPTQNQAFVNYPPGSQGAAYAEGADMNTEDTKHHKYVLVYNFDDKDHKKKRQRKPEQPKQQIHKHNHYHAPEKEEYEETHEHINHDYPPVYEEEHQPEIVFHYENDQSPFGSDSIKVIDPNGGRSQVEVTKDDYMRHVKLAAMKYLKEMETSFDGSKNKNYFRQEAPIREINNIKFGQQNFADSLFQSSKRNPVAVSTPASFRAPPPQPTEYNLAASAKVPKNVFSAGKPLKNAIAGMQATLGQNGNPSYRQIKASARPIDLSALDVGQTYESPFDHTAVLQNLQGFDMSNVVNPQFSPNAAQKPRLHFNKQTYHDINGLMHKNFQTAASQINEKEYSYTEPASFSGVHGGSANVGASITFGQKSNPAKMQNSGQDLDTLDSPIQIINGLPISNPYNIDIKTLRYMLGGLAQAEVDAHLKEYNHGSIKVKPKHTPLQQFTANSPLLPAMSNQNQNHFKNGNNNENNFNNNPNNNNFNHNFNNNNQKFFNNGNNGKNRNVRDSLTDNTGFSSGDFSSWNGGKTNINNNNQVIKSSNSNNGKQTVQSVAKDLISNASNLAPGQYIVRPVKKPQNNKFPYLFKRSSQELTTNLKPPAVVVQQATGVST